MAFESVTFTDTHTSAVASIDADYPVTVNAGDRIIALVNARTTDVGWAAKTGWTKHQEAVGVSGGPCFAIFEMDADADGTEGGTTETFTLASGTQRLAAAIIRLSSQGAIDASALTDYGPSTTAPVSPTVNSTVDGCLIIRVLGANLASTASVTAPSSPASTLEGYDGLQFGGAAIGVATEDSLQTSAGATGTATWTTDSSNMAPGTIVVPPVATSGGALPLISGGLIG